MGGRGALMLPLADAAARRWGWKVVLINIYLFLRSTI